MAAVAATGPLQARGGQLYCGDAALEPVVLELAGACRALAEDLPPAPGSAAAVHALLIVPSARVAVAHRDVIITAAEGVADALFTLPAVHAPEEVRAAKSVLRELVAAVPAPAPAGGPADGAPEVPASRPEQAGPSPSGRLAKLAQRTRHNGRRRAKALLPVLIVLAVTAGVGLGAWYAYGVPGAASPSSALSATGGPDADDAPSYTSATNYPGQEAGDILASPTGAADVAGVHVSLGAPVLASALVGRMLLCVPVSVHNATAADVPAGPVAWSMQSPTGVVEHAAGLDDDEVLAQGHIFPGDRMTGRVCFDEPGQAGMYIISFRPSTIGVAPPRGVWLVRLAAKDRH
jgi:hypothetical protein